MSHEFYGKSNEQNVTGFNRWNSSAHPLTAIKNQNIYMLIQKIQLPKTKDLVPNTLYEHA